jgi:hypothetical protein
MAVKKKGGGDRNNNRPKGKAWKKTVLIFDPVKRRLVKQAHPKA